PLVSGNQQIKNVDSQLQSLKMEIDRLSQERANAEQASADARAKAIDEQNEGHRRAQQTRQRAQATLMRIAVQESEIDQRLKNLLVERQRLSDNVIKAQMKLYAGSIQQLRASTPFLTGNVRLERFSKAAQKGYLVIGITSMEDVSEERLFTQMFGDITERSERGVHPRASTNKARAKAQGLPSDNAEKALLLVVPENERMARILRHL